MFYGVDLQQLQQLQGLFGSSDQALLAQLKLEAEEFMAHRDVLQDALDADESLVSLRH